MDLISLILGIAIGCIIARLVSQMEISELRKELREVQKECTLLRKESEEVEECGAGLEAYAERLRAHKNAVKREILMALKLRVHLGNREIAELANISSATVTRYMDELEREGKVVQEGKVGRHVAYKLNGSYAV